MKKPKNNNIILGFGYWVFEFGFSWCKGKVICQQKELGGLAQKVVIFLWRLLLYTLEYVKFRHGNTCENSFAQVRVHKIWVNNAISYKLHYTDLV